MTTKEAAQAWGITERRVNTLCKDERIPGAYKDGRQWTIPDGTLKPQDKRSKKATPVTASSRKKKLPLPLGISDYRKASTEYYYVDKTLLIRDFLDERPQVSLFVRPRRFGKTLTMDMLRTFFEKTSEDTSMYFKDKKIWACGAEYQAHQGAYPVIYVTFKDVKCEDWESTYDLITKILRNEFQRHIELLSSEKISAYDKAYIESVLNGTANKNDIALSFANLSRILDLQYNKAPVIIVDEYDTPIQQGHNKGFYNDVIDFIRNLFSGGFKDNPHLSYGFLTGILRVAKESIFSGLNNLKINSVLDNRYSEYFGFTSEEVVEMAAYYDAADKYQELCDWYDGYRFGNTDIFNPWSVIGYFNGDCIPKAFWVSTGSNDVIREVLASATPDIMERLESLVQGASFVTRIDPDVIYPQIQKDPSTIYSFLLVAGYLKVVKYDQPYGVGYMCEVALPNKEIASVYKKEILSCFEEFIPASRVNRIQEALYTHDVPALQKEIESFLVNAVSYHDTANETFYHGLVLGLCAMMDESYLVTSNREAGYGRYDIQLFPRDKTLPGFLFELKSQKDCAEDQLETLAQVALQQIDDRNYSTEMVSRGIIRIFKYGFAFSGKSVRVVSEEQHID